MESKTADLAGSRKENNCLGRGAGALKEGVELFNGMSDKKVGPYSSKFKF